MAVLAGSRLASEVGSQKSPFHCDTLVPLKAQMSPAETPLPPSRPTPEVTWVQVLPL